MEIDAQTDIVYMTPSEAYLVAELFSFSNETRPVQDKVWAYLTDWALRVVDSEIIREEVGTEYGGGALLGAALADCAVTDTNADIAIPINAVELRSMKTIAARNIAQIRQMAQHTSTEFHVGWTAMGQAMIATIDDYFDATQ